MDNFNSTQYGQGFCYSSLEDNLSIEGNVYRNQITTKNSSRDSQILITDNENQYYQLNIPYNAKYVMLYLDITKNNEHYYTNQVIMINKHKQKFDFEIINEFFNLCLTLNITSKMVQLSKVTIK